MKFPLVKMSPSWLLVSMYLLWILGSRLIRSNNQSSATLWVLETCLLVGLVQQSFHAISFALEVCEPLLGALLLGQGLCEGLEISLHEEAVLRLVVCGCRIRP